MVKKRSKMKIILLYVSSVDGKLTKWGQSHVHEWTSKEDAEQFVNAKEQNNLIVMGRSTFEVVKPQPQEGTLRVVLTRNPEGYEEATVPNQLEFSHESPTQLVTRLEKKGFSQMLLVSGRTLTTQFFKESLIDELWLTVEPKMFGNGDSMLLDEKVEINLELIETKLLNKQGTILVKYKVLK